MEEILLALAPAITFGLPYLTNLVRRKRRGAPQPVAAVELQSGERIDISGPALSEVRSQVETVLDVAPQVSTDSARTPQRTGFTAKINNQITPLQLVYGLVMIAGIVAKRDMGLQSKVRKARISPFKHNRRLYCGTNSLCRSAASSRTTTGITHFDRDMHRVSKWILLAIDIRYGSPIGNAIPLRVLTKFVVCTIEISGVNSALANWLKGVIQASNGLRSRTMLGAHNGGSRVGAMAPTVTLCDTAVGPAAWPTG